MKTFKHTLVTGFALFAMFLGAGNIIFPPTLGALAGDQWLLTLLGFLLTGICLPLLGIIASAKAGDNAADFGKYLGSTNAQVLVFLIIITIGPLLAIPRTGSVTYELAIAPIFPGINSYLAIAGFFTITAFCTLNANKVIDLIGSYLTPILMITLIIIIGLGIIHPIGQPVSTQQSQTFLKGFEGGYQTMDALASIVFSGIIMHTIHHLGYEDLKQKNRLTAIAGVIAGFGLLIVYGGFIYLGASASGQAIQDLSRVELLIRVIDQILGSWGSIGLGIIVALACLTTAVGLTATVAMYFSDRSSKLSYKPMVYIICIFSTILAVNGVDTIINFASPILSILYPVTIIIILLWLVDDWIKHKSIYKGAALGALLVSLSQVVFSAEDNINHVLKSLSWDQVFSPDTPLRVNFDTPLNILNSLPLSGEGFAWVIPAIIGGLLFLAWDLYQEHK